MDTRDWWRYEQERAARGPIAEGERVKAMRARAAAVEIAHKHDVPPDTGSLPAFTLPLQEPPSRQRHPVHLRTGKR